MLRLYHASLGHQNRHEDACRLVKVGPFYVSAAGALQPCYTVRFAP